MKLNAIILGLLLGTPAMAITDAEMDTVLSAMRIVESNNNPNAVGDNGNAIGVYQVWDSYWKDATEFSGIRGVYKDCYNPNYADRIVRAYMKRYANEKRLGREVTMEDIARIHNGGPRAVWATGKKKNNLDAYWAKVQKELNR
jgi:muramidase (phage lysozyme)